MTCSGARSPRVASGGEPPTPWTRSSVTPPFAASAASCTLGSAVECLEIGMSDLHRGSHHVNQVLGNQSEAQVTPVDTYPATASSPARVDVDLSAGPGA